MFIYSVNDLTTLSLNAISKYENLLLLQSLHPQRQEYISGE